MIKTHSHFHHTDKYLQQLNHFAGLAKCLSVRLWTESLWVRVLLQSLNNWYVFKGLFNILYLETSLIGLTMLKNYYFYPQIMDYLSVYYSLNELFRRKGNLSENIWFLFFISSRNTSALQVSRSIVLVSREIVSSWRWVRKISNK